jgi:hypothetical protein
MMESSRSRSGSGSGSGSGSRSRSRGNKAAISKTKPVSSSASSDDSSASDDDISLTSSQILDLSELNLVLSHYLLDKDKGKNITDVLMSISISLKDISNKLGKK